MSRLQSKEVTKLLREGVVGTWDLTSCSMGIWDILSCTSGRRRFTSSSFEIEETRRSWVVWGSLSTGMVRLTKGGVKSIVFSTNDWLIKDSQDSCSKRARLTKYYFWLITRSTSEGSGESFWYIVRRRGWKDVRFSTYLEASTVKGKRWIWWLPFVDASKIIAPILGDNHSVQTLVQLLFCLGWWLRQGVMGPVSQ